MSLDKAADMSAGGISPTSPASPEAAEYLAGPPTDFYVTYPLDEDEQAHLRAMLACMRSEMSKSSQADHADQADQADLADEEEIEAIDTSHMDTVDEMEDAPTSEAAFALAEQRAQQRQVSVTVYRRDGISYDQEYGWVWEGQRILAILEPDGSSVYYLADDPDDLADLGALEDPGNQIDGRRNDA